MSDEKIAFLRHTLATLAYRGGKVLRDAPPAFASYRAGRATRSPLEILSHVGDLLDWAAEMADGRATWREATPATWDEQVGRFFSGLERVDAKLAAETGEAFPAERIFQGPVADALTHVGQLAILRGLAGSPVRGENYFKAEIAAGRVGREQASPVREF